jgi:hypothetical protein
MSTRITWQFRGVYHAGYLYTDSEHRTHGGFIYRKLKKQVTVDVAGKPRFISQRTYLIRRHHD